MTRKEEIKAKAKEWIKQFPRCFNEDECRGIDSIEAFEASAKWADKTTIKKAYKWIKENFANYVGVDVSDYDIHDEEFADDFLKAMEE